MILYGDGTIWILHHDFYLCVGRRQIFLLSLQKMHLCHDPILWDRDFFLLFLGVNSFVIVSLLINHLPKNTCTNTKQQHDTHQANKR